MAQGIVTESEGQLLREVEALTARVIAVDHFDPAEVKPHYKSSADRWVTIRAASKAPRQSRLEGAAARGLPRNRDVAPRGVAMFKALSRPLPDLKDWRFSVDQWGIAWAVFDREGESQNSLGRRPLEELARSSARWRRARATSRSAASSSSPARRTASSSAPTCASSTDFTTEREVDREAAPCQRLLDRIERLPVPVVCGIHGFCLGGGLELALACHWRIATRDDGTTLGFPEVRLGIFPGFNGTRARSARPARLPPCRRC